MTPHRRIEGKKIDKWQDLNPRPSDYETCVLEPTATLTADDISFFHLWLFEDDLFDLAFFEKQDYLIIFHVHRIFG